MTTRYSSRSTADIAFAHTRPPRAMLFVSLYDIICAHRTSCDRPPTYMITDDHDANRISPRDVATDLHEAQPPLVY
eukprot:scaffold12664_cov107-Isochrysis_galbana.AAC.4